MDDSQVTAQDSQPEEGFFETSTASLPNPTTKDDNEADGSPPDDDPSKPQPGDIPSEHGLEYFDQNEPELYTDNETDFAMAVTIPAKFGHVLIGSGGKIIRLLQSTTNTFIDVEKQAIVPIKRVQVRGDWRSVCKGISLIGQKLAPLWGPMEAELEYKIGILLPDPHLPGFLIGTKGATISKIEADTECSLKMVRNPVGPQQINIKANSVEAFNSGIFAVVKKRMEFLFKDFDDPLATGIANSRNQREEIMEISKKTTEEQIKELSEIEESTSIHFLVPFHSVTFLIGSKGSVINKIQSDSNTKINVERGAPFSEYGRTVRIEGKVDLVCSAIKECIKQVNNHKSEWSRETDKPWLEEETPKVITGVLVPPGLGRWLIGKAGASVQKLEADSGARLRVKRLEPCEVAEISGTWDQVNSALDMVVCRLVTGGLLDGRSSLVPSPWECPHLWGRQQPMWGGGGPGGWGPPPSAGWGRSGWGPPPGTGRWGSAWGRGRDRDRGGWGRGGGWGGSATSNGSGRWDPSKWGNSRAPSSGRKWNSYTPSGYGPASSGTTRPIW